MIKKLLIMATLIAMPISVNALDIKMAEEVIKVQLSDPDSAKFKDMHSYKKEGLTYICGTYNAKNKFGGYVGYIPFLMSNEDYVEFDYPSMATESQWVILRACMGITN